MTTFKIKQIKLNKMDVFCYLIEDLSTKTCALIDPAFETGRILNIVKEKGLKTTHLINTHCHSDHTAGNSAIIAATKARLYIHALDAGRLGALFNSAFSRMLGGKGSPAPGEKLSDNDIISVGKTNIKVIHTPGHTPGGICLYLKGHVITGDTLFVGAVGRTDLPGGSAKQLRKSIREKIYCLPDNTIIWPGHDYGRKPHSTVQREKQTNPFTL